jgi:3-methyl-2-oxobutanoate hydroxymethyltransferase
MSFQNRILTKKNREKIVMLTAYDYQMARILDQMRIDLILVGDSLGMVVQGHRNTKSVTMDNMIYHTSAVAKGVKNTPIIGDLPINSCNTTEDCLRNSKSFLASGADGVKIEGNKPKIVQDLVNAGIPVMGHVGMLPQTAETYRVKGKTSQEAERILQDSIELDECGVFSIVLECIPERLAKEITGQVKAPTIGIGAGKYCDGQVLVTNDLLGLDDVFMPKFVKRYANINIIVKNAISNFKEEVLGGKYPSKEHTYH